MDGCFVMIDSDGLKKSLLIPLTLQVGQIREDLANVNTPLAQLVVASVRHLPADRFVVVDKDRYEFTKEGLRDEGSDRREGTQLEREPEPGGSEED
jgi:hypothetical protein